ncbi:MAG: hypothetical protein ACI9HI_000490 [Salinirussus sp.]|jgi:hypothetical protein
MAGDPAPSDEAEADPASGDQAGADDPAFEIPAWPERRYPYDDGVTYEGSTVFRLTPVEDHSESALVELVKTVLCAGPYRFGDYYDLPMPVYLVRDEGTADVFRTSVRDGRVGLHVLPATESSGLRAFFERLAGRTETGWTVDYRVEH